jgi:hypothetical protein
MARLDGIIPALLKKSTECLLAPLCRIYRACLVYRFVPTACGQIKVIYIPKPGEDNYIVTRVFKPISFPSSFKILQKMKDTCLRYILIKTPINKLQIAYQQIN